MKTYIDKKGKACSFKPDIFKVGVDNNGNTIYNNDIIYHYDNIFPRIEFLEKDFENYNENYFNNTYKIYQHQVPELLTYLAQLFENKSFNSSLKKIPNIGDEIILKGHNYRFKVLDNKYKLFIKVQSMENPNYITIKPIYEFKN